MNFYYGVVENRDDPLKLGRCQVRVVGLHTQDKGLLPTADLPWAQPMQPITSAAMNGIGWAPVGPVPGTSVIVVFADEERQQPIMIGTVGGIPHSKQAAIAAEDTGSIVTDGGVLKNPDGTTQTKSDGTPVTISNINDPIGAATSALDDALNDVGTQARAVASSALDKVANTVNKLVGTSITVSGIDKATKKTQSLTLPVQGADDERKPTVVPVVVPKKEAAIDAQPEPAKANPKVLAAKITLEPPAKYVRKGTVGQARQSIAALVAACDKVGLTHKYAKASILAICGGESQWLPIEEDHVYNSVDALMNYHASIFKGDRDLATQYSGGKKTKQEFFELVYGHKYPKGRGMGNVAPGDGAKYYGRGFNQLTGKAGYARVMNEMKKYGVNVDLVSNPKLLIDDINVAALACAIYYKVNVKHPQDDPGYFEAAKKRTGKNAGKGYEVKKVCYEYFLGQGVLSEPTNKPPAEDPKGTTYTPQEVQYQPKEKQAALLEDRSANGVNGFCDPNGKYPLRNLIDEPDTNRLARGVIKETAIAYKDQIRTTDIPGVFGSTWEQPLAPFGGKYPYNKVYETESGHVQMFDDTTGHETISLYHRKGTFIDVDANGTQVNKIVGDGYTIYDRNGMIYVTGKCNLTVGNSVNIMVMGDANIEVNGGVEAVFHGEVDIGCAKDVNMAVGGNFNLLVNGDYNTFVGGNKNTVTYGNNLEHTGGNKDVSVVGDSKTAVSGSLFLDSTGDLSIKSAANVKTDAGSMLSLYGAEARLTGESAVHLKSTGGQINVDGTAFHAQQQLAQPTEGFDSFDRAAVPTTELSAPSPAEAAADGFPLLDTPVRPAPVVEINAPLQGDGDISYNPAAEAAGVSTHRYPQPDVGTAAKQDTQPPAKGLASGDMYEFLTKILEEAKEGKWCEIGMRDNMSCAPNIKKMWDDLGLGGVPNKGVNYKGKIVAGDQVPWCAAFVNYCLKNTGYRWAREARAYGFKENPSRWGATNVTDTVQPGDVVVWNFSHVSLVYKVFPDGSFYTVGGNQGGKDPRNNNPVGGMVTIAGKSGPVKWKTSHKDINSIWRIAKQ